MNCIIRIDEAHMAQAVQPEFTAVGEAVSVADIAAADRSDASAHRRGAAVCRRRAARRIRARRSRCRPVRILPALLDELRQQYEGRGVNLMKVAGKWQFRTAKDLGFLLHKHAVEERRLSRAAIETLSIIAYHQPVTRAEIEDIRGVMVSKGTVDALMEVGWVHIRGRRRTPGSRN